MKFTFKNYKIKKTKNYIKKNSIFFFFGGIIKNSNNWINIEQNLKQINFNCYKIFNKTTKKTLKSSIYKTIVSTVNSNTFLIQPKTNQIFKQNLELNFEPLLFNMLAIKLNNKIYQTIHFKNAYSLNYNCNKLSIYQFGIVYLKKKSK